MLSVSAEYEDTDFEDDFDDELEDIDDAEN